MPVRSCIQNQQKVCNCPQKNVLASGSWFDIRNFQVVILFVIPRPRLLLKTADIQKPRHCACVMSLININCSVVCVPTNSLIVPWTILAENIAERTLEQYFVSRVQKNLSSGSGGPLQKSGFFGGTSWTFKGGTRHTLS